MSIKARHRYCGWPQRLLNRLLPYLTNWLEQQQNGTPHADLLQEFQQQAAVAALEHQEPVKAQSTSKAVLVRSVDIATGDQFVHLGFKEQEIGPVVASIGLPTQALRQLLGIVYQQYRLAQWPTDAWPVWVSEGGALQVSKGQVALH